MQKKHTHNSNSWAYAVVPPFMRSLPPEFHAAVFFLAVFFRIMHNRLSKRGTTRSLNFPVHNKGISVTVYYPPPNLSLKAEIKGTPLILPTAKESSKGKVPLSEINTLLSVTIFRKANYLTRN